MYTSKSDIAAAITLELRKSAEKIKYAEGGGGAGINSDGSRVAEGTIVTKFKDRKTNSQGG